MPNKRGKKPGRPANVNRRLARELYDDQGLLWTFVAHLEPAEARELLFGTDGGSFATTPSALMSSIG